MIRTYLAVNSVAMCVAKDALFEDKLGVLSQAIGKFSHPMAELEESGYHLLVTSIAGEAKIKRFLIHLAPKFCLQFGFPKYEGIG